MPVKRRTRSSRASTGTNMHSKLNESQKPDSDVPFFKPNESCKPFCDIPSFKELEDSCKGSFKLLKSPKPLNK